MTERAAAERRDGSRVNWRATDGGVRLYDEDDPDAWVEVEFEAGVPPAKRLWAVCPECGLAAPQRTGPGRGMVCGDCGAEVDRQ